MYYAIVLYRNTQQDLNLKFYVPEFDLIIDYHHFGSLSEFLRKICIEMPPKWSFDTKFFAKISLSLRSKILLNQTQVRRNRQESNLYLQIFSLSHRPDLLLFQIWVMHFYIARRPSNRLFLFLLFVFLVLIFRFFLFRHFVFNPIFFSF